MKKIACIVKGYPRLSETFIAQEILALEQAGVNIIIYSLRHPTDKSVHPVHGKIKAKVHYLPEYLYQHPIRVLTGTFKALLNFKFYPLLLLFLKDLIRDPSPNRVRRFGQALVLANEIEADRQWLYVHFLHTPASVTRYTSKLLNLPWSCSAHAKDIWTSSKWDIREKMLDLEWLVTCTKTNVSYLKQLSAEPTKVELLYHGLDLSRFPKPNKSSAKDGSDKKNKVKIISVGRAVSKKGYDVLLNALSEIPDDLHWEFIHIGGGGLLPTLKSQADSLGIRQNIFWLGAQNFEKVLEIYQQADIFTLASRVDESGDRDGLPNVLMEAMTQAIPCVATNISGIPELIEDHENGLLVESEDSVMLCQAITDLIENPELRQRIGFKGYQTIQNRFSLNNNIQTLIQKFE